MMFAVKNLLVLFLLTGLVFSEETNDRDQTVKEVRRVVERAIPFLEEEMIKWNKREDCVSCHNALPIIWSLNNAKQQNFTVNDQLLQDWNKKSLQWTRKVPDESLAYLLLGRDRTLTGKELRSYLEQAQTLLKQQRSSGSWKKGGQQIMQKRRAKNSSVETTLWSALGIASLGAGKPDFIQGRDKALEWVETQMIETTEGQALRLLLSQQMESAKTGSESELLRAQNDDGGWGWRDNESSDVISTGQALYALGSQGLEAQKEVQQKAWIYLMSKQEENGAWHTTMQLKGWNPEHEEQAVYWGTAWALLGLVNTLPK